MLILVTNMKLKKIPKINYQINNQIVLYINLINILKTSNISHLIIINIPNLNFRKILEFKALIKSIKKLKIFLKILLIKKLFSNKIEKHIQLIKKIINLIIKFLKNLKLIKNKILIIIYI